MESPKLELMEKMEQKGLNVAQVAETMGFSAEVLGLYLVKDAYPVPTRILKKLTEAIEN